MRSRTTSWRPVRWTTSRRNASAGRSLHRHLVHIHVQQPRERLALLERLLVELARLLFAPEYAHLAGRREDVQLLLGVIEQLGLAAVLHHRHADLPVDELLHH